MATVEEICRIADENGIGEAFRAILANASRYEMVVYPHKRAIRFAPPHDKRRYLLTIWAEPVGAEGRLLFDIYPKAFAEFYPISVDDAEALLGKTGRYEVEEIEPTAIPELNRALDAVFEHIQKRKR